MQMPHLPDLPGGRLAARLSPSPASTLPAALGSSITQFQVARKTFWRVFNDWMVTASDREVEQLDNALHEHAPHVRPIHAALSDAMRQVAASMSIPMSLLAALDAAGWAPEGARIATACVTAVPLDAKPREGQRAA